MGTPVDSIDSSLDVVYATRFGPRRADRVTMWEVLVEEHFQRYIGPDDTVLDLAAGYCEFINTVRCGRKVAVDLNPTILEVAGPDVEVHHASCTDLPADLTGSGRRGLGQQLLRAPRRLGRAARHAARAPPGA